MTARRFALVISLLLGSAPIARAAPPATIARCSTIGVTAGADGTVAVTIAKRRLSGRLVAVESQGSARALTLDHVREGGAARSWRDDLTVVLLDGARRGVVVFWKDKVFAEHADADRAGDRCPAPAKALPSASPAPSCAERLDRDFPADQGEVSLVDEARLLLCDIHAAHLRERARFGLALAAFLDGRERDSTTSAEEIFDGTGKLAAGLVAACVAMQDTGISTHNQGIVLWPEFARAQCFRHLQAALDPAKELPGAGSAGK